MAEPKEINRNKSSRPGGNSEHGGSKNRGRSYNRRRPYPNRSFNERNERNEHTEKTEQFNRLENGNSMPAGKPDSALRESTTKPGLRENTAKTNLSIEHSGQSTRQAGHLPPKHRQLRNHSEAAEPNSGSLNGENVKPSEGRAARPFNRNKRNRRQEETIADISAENKQLEKEISLEILSIHTITLD